MAGNASRKAIKLTEEQKKEGYRVEISGEYVLVWHRNNQVALLRSTPDIQEKVHNVVEKRRQELREVEAATGWKANP